MSLSTTIRQVRVDLDRFDEHRLYYFEGTGSADGRVITQECRYDAPVKGPCSWRSVATIKDVDALEYETYLTPVGGREEKMSVMILTRKR